MSRFIIEYDSMIGDIVPDGKVQKYVDDMVLMVHNENLSSPIIIIVGSVVLLDALRVAIKEKRLDRNTTTIHFEGKDYKVDKNARMTHWPVGLCDVYDDILDRLVI